MAEIDLEALARKVEALDGPCRETDQDIHEIVVIQSALSGTPYPHSRKYTASLEAAMSLMPAGAYWMAGKEHGKPWARCFEIGKVYGAPEEYGEYREAATVALAMCSAALRARLMKGEGE